VSRASVREAIGSLQVRGIVQTRPSAGSYLVDNASQLIRDQAADDAPVAGVGPFALLEARAVLEPGIARAAAERGTSSARAEELLEQMDEAIDLDDADARSGWNEADRFFHRELAVMTGNPVFVSLADQVARWMDQPLWRRLRDDSIWVPGRTTCFVSEHRLIYQEIVEGQPEAAAFQAANHVRRVGRQMRDTTIDQKG
jgi:DNA-binding FadR family transcriptional regulator